ncbi:MAG: aspartate aminotransferase family protein [Pseudomonadota bacterium]
MSNAKFEAMARETIAGACLGRITLPAGHRFTISRGEGAYIFDANGQRYLDHLIGSGSSVLGHRHPAITEAITQQLQRGTNYYYLDEVAIELAGLLCEAIPCADKIKYVTSGTEGTDVALRVARAYTGRQKILKFEGAYHGFHDYAMQSSQFTDPTKVKSYPEAILDSPGIPDALLGTVLVAPFNDAETLARIIDQHKHEIAAIIVEPFQRTVAPLPGFLSEVRRLSTENDIILIFDEVVTGFRFAYGGAQERYGVIPDLAVFAKTIGGGFPCGAIAGKAQYMELLDPNSDDPRTIFFTGTYSGNPITCAAGLATLKELSKPGVYDQLNGYGDGLRKGLEEIFQRRGIQAQVHGDGSVSDFTITDIPVVDYRSEMSGDVELKTQIKMGVIERGVFAPYKLYVSTMHGDEELATVLQAFDDAVVDAFTSSVVRNESSVAAMTF